jgi:hypothetical protein
MMRKKKQTKDSPHQKMIKVKMTIIPPPALAPRKVRVTVREEVMALPLFYIDRTPMNDKA